MNCIELFGNLSPADRAVCWRCFTELSGIFSALKNQKNSAETAAAYRVPAEEINERFEKNGIKRYFDTAADDESFIKRLLDEMKSIEKLPRLRD